jgi:hypothetical protein
MLDSDSPTRLKLTHGASQSTFWVRGPFRPPSPDCNSPGTIERSLSQHCPCLLPPDKKRRHVMEVHTKLVIPEMNVPNVHCFIAQRSLHWSAVSSLVIGNLLISTQQYIIYAR